MSAQTLLWATVGLLTGGVHATALWRAAHRPATIGAAMGIVRIAGVGAMLVLAAVNQGIVPAAVGWGLAYSSMGMFLWIRPSP